MRPATAVNHLLTESIWNHAVADRTRTELPRHWAGAAGGQQLALAALIDDHDREHDDVDGPDRAASILASIVRRAGQVRAAQDELEAWSAGGAVGPRPEHWSRDVVASLYSAHRGVPDPALLLHAPQVTGAGRRARRTATPHPSLGRVPHRDRPRRPRRPGRSGALMDAARRRRVRRSRVRGLGRRRSMRPGPAAATRWGVRSRFGAEQAGDVGDELGLSLAGGAVLLLSR